MEANLDIWERTSEDDAAPLLIACWLIGTLPVCAIINSNPGYHHPHLPEWEHFQKDEGRN